MVLVMYLRNPDTLMDESRAFGAIVADWFKVRGADAESVNLIAVSDPLYHQAIKDWFEGVHSLDVTLRPIFKQVGFTLALHNSEGVKLSERAFSPGEFTEGETVELLMKQVCFGSESKEEE